VTSTRPVSGTPGAATTSTASGSARPESEAAGPTRPVLEHRARAQLGILGVLGLCAAVCLWVVWRTGPGKVRALDLAEAAARGWPAVAVPTDSQYILRQPLGQLLYRLLPVHGTNIRYAPACPRFDGGRVRVGAVVRSAGTYQGERGKLVEIMGLTARLDPAQHRGLGSGFAPS
jgi:hypothetical protein